MLVFRPFQWEIGHNTLQQSWITIKSQHFHPKKSDLGPVHLDQISDKLDYLSCPSGQNFFFHFFSIGQGTSSLEKWNWHLLIFFSFTFITAQCVQCDLPGQVLFDSMSSSFPKQTMSDGMWMGKSSKMSSKFFKSSSHLVGSSCSNQSLPSVMICTSSPLLTVGFVCKNNKKCNY